MKKYISLLVVILLLLSGCNAVTSKDCMTCDDKLFLSIANGNLQGIEDAIKEGASLEAFDWTYSKTLIGYILSEKNPLCYAAQYSDDRVFETLLSSGADPNSASSILGNEMPILIYTVWNDAYQKTRLLLEHGAEVNLTYKTADVLDQLFTGGGRVGTENESIRILNLLVEYNCTIDEANINKAVQYAAEGAEWNLNLLRQLFRLANQEAYKNQDKLLIAFLTGDDETVKSLLQNKYLSDNPVFLSRIAAAFGDPSDLQQMLAIGYPFGSEALVAAAMYDNMDTFSYLKEQGILLDGKNAVRIPLAALNGNADILHQLLDMSPLFQGSTLLYIGDAISEECSEYYLYVMEVMAACIQSGNLESVKCAQSFFDGYIFTESDLYKALSAGMYPIAEYIHDCTELNLSDSIAELCGTKYEIAQFVFTRLNQKVSEQIKINVGISAAKHGNTQVLDLVQYEKLESASKEIIAQAAIEHGQVSALEYMYEHNLSSDLLLSDACRNPSQTVFELVFHHTANIDASDEKSGRTALHWAILSGYKEYTQFLVEKGADVQIKDCEGITGEEYMKQAGWEIQ